MPEILLVEDSPVQARALMSYFELTEYQVVCTERLEDAIELVRLKPIDGIILDLSLPDSRGLDTFLRMREAVDSVPIVILTSTDDEDLALEMLRNGAQDYLIKGEVTSDWVRRSVEYSIQRCAASKQGNPGVREPKASLQINVEDDHDVTIVRVQQKQLLDTDVIEQLRSELLRLADRKRNGRFVLDCSELEYVSNSALGQWLDWDHRVRDDGGSVRLCSLRPEVVEQMKARKILAQFNVCIDLPTALQAF